MSLPAVMIIVTVTFQNYIVAAGTVQWPVTTVFSAYSWRLPASDDRMVALSRPMHSTDGQSAHSSVCFHNTTNATATVVSVLVQLVYFSG